MRCEAAPEVPINLASTADAQEASEIGCEARQAQKTLAEKVDDDEDAFYNQKCNTKAKSTARCSASCNSKKPLNITSGLSDISLRDVCEHLKPVQPKAARSRHLLKGRSGLS